MPRSLIAVPLVDDEGSLGVLEVLDKRGQAGFDLRDVELATVFARQATVAIRASRIERDTAGLLRSVLGGLETALADEAAGGSGAEPTTVDVEALVRDATVDLDAEDEGSLWALADEIVRLRSVDPDEIDLVRELLAVLVHRAERGRAGRPSRTR